MHLAGSSLGNQIPGPDDLYSGNIRTQPLKVAAGEYQRGDVLGLDSATSTLGDLADEADAFAIMPFNVTLTAATDLTVYVGGDFNEDAVGIGAGDLAAIKVALSARGISLRKWGVAPASV